MDYFVLEQEERLNVSLDFRDKGFAGEEPFVTYLRFDKTDRLPDVFCGMDRGRLCLCVSDEMKTVIDAYGCFTRTVPCFLTDGEYRDQRVYWKGELREADCLKQEIYADRRGLTLISEPKPEHHLFQAGIYKKKYALVSLELAENLIRRQAYGMRLYPVNRASH